MEGQLGLVWEGHVEGTHVGKRPGLSRHRSSLLAVAMGKLWSG